MRKTHFLLIAVMLFSVIALNLTAPINADEPHGTRSPDAGVEITPPSNKTGKPTDTLSYAFIVKNTGDENDSFRVSASSNRGWLMNWSNHDVGPLEVNESISVPANITIPMGIPANTIDELTFSAQSILDISISDQVKVNSTVIEAFVVSVDIEGGYNKTSSIDPPGVTNYTLTVRNMGNLNVTITLKHSLPRLNWDVTFPKYPNGRVTIDEANLTNEGIEQVNLTITAPIDAKPDHEMTITLWGEKTDIFPPWFSWQYQNNITIRTIVQSRLGVRFTPERTIGYVSSGDTLYNFTMENSGNKDITVDLVIKRDQILLASLDRTQVTVRVGQPLPIGNTLRVSTAANAPLGNYTIKINATDNLTGQPVGEMELYFIIVPVLSITNISISDPEPMQYKTTNVFVTIENIGYVDATDITVKLYDGKKKVKEIDLDEETDLDEFKINASEDAEVKIKWAPSDFGNRTIRVTIDVEGIGNFSMHGTDITENMTAVKVKINWQPYYLVIYVIIAMILGIATLSSILQLKFYRGRPHLNDYAEGMEDIDYEEYPEEEEFPEGAEKQAEAPFATAGVTGELEEPKEVRPLYKKPREKPAGIFPEKRREPIEREAAPPKDPETIRKENELREEISRVQDKLDKTKSLGVDTTNIYQLLRTAKKSLNDRDYNKSKQYLGYANERLDNLIVKREEALKAIKEAKEILSGMRGTADLTIVENFLVKADSLLAEGDFREAINYANKAKERAVRLQRREMRL
jgi:hypothetical protein